MKTNSIGPALARRSDSAARVRLATLAALCAVGTALSPMQAFPPAPPHTLFGMVRNQWGDPIDVTGGTVFVENAGGSGATAPITASTQPGVNYLLRVPMDSFRRPDAYQAAALGRNQPFRLKVQIGNVLYVPIEMALVSGAGQPIGEPGGSTQLNLTLGVDSDRDGLPDVWEQSLISRLGGTLAGITSEGDADGDGLSNRQEFEAGTLAYDAADGFRLELKSLASGTATLEFLAIPGRTYTIHASSDLNQWTAVSVQPAGGGAPRDTLTTPEVRYLQVEVPGVGATNRYFKAMVR